MSTRTVKLYFNGDIRRTRISESASFQDLKDLIERLFGSDVSLSAKITYKDEDGDDIRILSDEEIEEAMNDAKSQGKPLKLKIDLPEKPVTSVVSPQTTSDDFELVKEEDASENIPLKEEEVSANVLPEEDASENTPLPEPKNAWPTKTDVKQSFNPKEKLTEDRKRERKRVNAEKKAERKRVNAEKKAERQRIKEERQRVKQERQRVKEERKQAKEEFKRSHGSSWRHEWRQHNNNQREKAREEFRDDIKSFLEDKEVISALQQALPLAADMLLKGARLKDIIDAILEAQPALRDHALIIRILPLIHNFVGLIPTEIFVPILLDVILDLQQFLNDGPPDVPVHRLFKRIFGTIKRSVRNSTPNVHYGVVCDGDACPEGTGPIVGNRWKKKGCNYDLCDKCFVELDEENKKDFVNVEVHGWRPPCAFGIPGFHPGPFMPFGGLPRCFQRGFGGRRRFGGSFTEK